MKPEQFKRKQKKLMLTNQQIADEIGVTLSTIQKWRNGSVTIPKYVKIVMDCLA
jgi:transcriptional regulator with XRE-family HTH domain